MRVLLACDVHPSIRRCAPTQDERKNKLPFALSACERKRARVSKGERPLLKCILLSAALALIAGTASAQVSADKPIRIVIPYPPGASADMSSRLIGQKVEELGGPKVIVESRPGGGGTVAAMTVKTAPAEPISLFLADVGSFGVNQTLLPDQPFDREKDFKPVASLYEFPSVLMVPATLQANTVAELVALAKRSEERRVGKECRL